MRFLLVIMAAAPASAAVDIGSSDLGTLGTATGTTSFVQAASYTSDDEQRHRFTFDTSTAGTLNLALYYSDELRSPLVEICPDPDDPNSCYVEPNGDYQDYAGVRLTRLVLTSGTGSVVEVALPEGFIDLLSGERPGRGYPSFGFDSIDTSYWLENPFSIGAGSFTADLYGFGLIRGASFSGEGGGIVSYAFDFSAAAIPEPASWALMVAGFAIAGAGVRGARSQREGLRIVPA
jgi:hypothetical protein